MNNRARSLLIIAFVPAAILLMINVHEIGHTVLARLFGDSQAAYHLYERFPNGGFCIGCSIYDHSQLSDLGNLFTAVGGVLFTQGIAILALFARKVRIKNSTARHLAMILAVVFALDLPLQILQALRINVQVQTYPTQVDLADFTYLLSSQINISVSIIKIALLVVLVIYLLWMMRLYRA